MSITEKLPSDYRFTEGDVSNAYDILANCEKPTETQLELMTLGFLAEETFRKTGLYPTLFEAVQQFKSEQHEREAQRVASWQDSGRVTDFDFACYSERIAEDDTDGGFMNFMSVAEKLRESSRKNLTVGEVRKAMRQK